MPFITSSLMTLPSGRTKYGFCPAIQTNEKPSRMHRRPRDMSGGELGRTKTFVPNPISLMLMSREVRVETVPLAVRKMMGHFKGVGGTLNLWAPACDRRPWLAPESTIHL